MNKALGTLLVLLTCTQLWGAVSVAPEQPYSDTLAEWAAIDPDTKQDQSDNLDDWSLIAPSTKSDSTHTHTLLSLDNASITNQLRLLSTALTATGTNVVIILATNAPARRYVVATTNINWTVEAGALDGSSVDIAIANASGGLITNTFPATWVFFGAPAPSVMLSNTFARFTLQYWSGLTNYHAFFSPSF